MSPRVHAHTLLLKSQRTDQAEHHAAVCTPVPQRLASNGDLEAAADTVIVGAGPAAASEHPALRVG